MRKTIFLTLIVFIAIGLTACVNSENPASKAKDVLTSYFSAFEKAEYESMKQYCTNEFVENYFHGNDGHELGVFDSKKAKILAFTDREIDTGNENTLAFEIVIEKELMDEVAKFDGDGQIQKDYPVYILEKQADGNWLICAIRYDM